MKFPHLTHHLLPNTPRPYSQTHPVPQVTVGPVGPNQEVDISVEMCSPPEQGMFQGKWRMCNPGGNFFGGKDESLENV